MTSDWTLPSIPFKRTERLVVGVSGGSDSLFLLHLLLEKLPESRKRLIVAHVNYGLRGRASELDESLVREICRRNGLPVKILRVRQFKDKVKRQKRSLQDWAREVRYRFFQGRVLEAKAWGAAVAHHQEDQAETVMERLLRGAGPRGLSGLKPVQSLVFNPKDPPLRVWRPLLGYSKGQIQGFLNARKIIWREDRSNRENKYLRNQVRNDLLPYLSKWNPNLIGTLARLGEITAAEDEWMDSLLKPMGPPLRSRWGKDSYQCLALVFEKLPTAFQRRWVRLTVEKACPAARGLSFERIEEIIRLWSGLERGPRDLGYGLRAGRVGLTAFLRWKG